MFTLATCKCKICYFILPSTVQTVLLIPLLLRLASNDNNNNLLLPPSAELQSDKP